MFLTGFGIYKYQIPTIILIDQKEVKIKVVVSLWGTNDAISSSKWFRETQRSEFYSRSVRTHL